jgi:thiol-disulfide isomerase/thioredoxin
VVLAGLALGPWLLTAGSAAAFNFAPTDAGPVPEVTFLDGQDREQRLADYRGRVVVLNLWATWCVPCRREMPSLDRLQSKLGGTDLAVLAVSLDRGEREQIVAFYDELGISNLAVLRDPSASLGRALRAPGLPTTLVIDRQGEEVGRVLGDAEWDGPAAVELLETLIAH